MEGELFRADRHDEDNSRPSQFCKSAWKVIVTNLNVSSWIFQFTEW